MNEIVKTIKSNYKTWVLMLLKIYLDKNVRHNYVSTVAGLQSRLLKKEKRMSSITKVQQACTIFIHCHCIAHNCMPPPGYLYRRAAWRTVAPCLAPGRGSAAAARPIRGEHYWISQSELTSSRSMDWLRRILPSRRRFSLGLVWKLEQSTNIREVFTMRGESPYDSILLLVESAY